MGILFTITLAMISGPLYAQETGPLGAGSLAVKVDYLGFTESSLKPSEDGTYVGLEGYMNLSGDTYAGMEIGYMNASGCMSILEQELTYIPVEFNAKHVFQIMPSVAVSGGFGISYNYCELELSDYTGTYSDTEWVFGGQVFADINYTHERFFAGLNGKYQVTEDADDLYGINFGGSVELTNWRIGGQVGVRF